MFRKYLRASRRISDFLPLAVILSLVLSIVGMIIASVILGSHAIGSFIDRAFNNYAVKVFFLQYLQFFGIWVVMLLLLLIPYNRPMKEAFFHNEKGNNPKGLLRGLGLGFGANGICILISALMGDIKLSFRGANPLVLLVFFIAVFIQSGGEEIVDRLYLYQKLRRRYAHPAVAILVNSVVFACLHIGNPGFTVIAGAQICAVGVIMSLLVYYYNSLWAAMAFHAAWNYTQNIIFGLPNSGIVAQCSIFKLEAASARNGFFYNVNFGVEGSVGATLLLIALAFGIWWINRTKGEAVDIWAGAEAEGLVKEREKEAIKEAKRLAKEETSHAAGQTDDPDAIPEETPEARRDNLLSEEVPSDGPKGDDTDE